MGRTGKYLIESLTRSMYEDSRCIFREYVQNAADQIDIAKAKNLEENGYYDIQIWIDRESKRIEIEDSATGISMNQVHRLEDVGCSTKQRAVNKGFRGIGRLGGLGYCSKLIFETSAKGENKRTIMTWDATKMNTIVDDESDESEIQDVINQCVSYEYKDEETERHYFKVIMENVTDEKLLNMETVSDYLSMIAPVDYPTRFSIFGNKIKQYMNANGLSLDTYNIFVNGDQIYKGYTTRIQNRRDGDYDITDIKFFEKKNENGEFIYWGWYSISELKGQIQSYNLPYGIRLRCKNIQVGDEGTCRKFFASEIDKRFSQYFYGELNIVTPNLQPDARRDYLRPGDARDEFERLVTSDFLTLKGLCNQASDLRSAAKKHSVAVNKQKEIKEKEKKGFLSEVEKAKSEQDFARYQRESEEYRKKFALMKKKSEESQSPLDFMIRNLETASPSLTSSPTNTDKLQQNILDAENPNLFASIHEDIPKTILRTDKPIYKKFNQREKQVINSVYNAIYTAIADDQLREILINKIEQEITK